jgi:hypothetical protein
MEDGEGGGLECLFLQFYVQRAIHDEIQTIMDGSVLDIRIG